MFKNLLGSEEYKIIKLLELNENILLSGINSSGISTVTRAILEVLNENNYLTLHLFSFEIENLSEVEIENYFKVKLKSIFGIDLSSFDELFIKTNYKLIVAIDKIECFKNKDILIKFLQEVRSKSFYKLSFIVTSSLDFYFNSNIQYGGFHKFLFRGFIEKYPELIKSFEEYYNIPKVSALQLEKIRQYSGQHTGLTKAILINFKNEGKLIAVPELLNNNDDLISRCELLITDLRFANLAIEDILNDKKIDSFVNLGLCYKDKVSSILELYTTTKIEKKVTNLTKTEQKIFEELNFKTYKSIEDLLTLIEKEDEYGLTTWVVYKHINNINKKIKNTGVKITSDRKKGYILKNE